MKLWIFLVFTLFLGPFLVSDLSSISNSTYSMEIVISEGLSLRNPSIELHAYLNSTLEMDVECPFEYIGSNPIIQLNIEFSQETPPVLIENVSTVIDVLYISDSNARQYFVGSYHDTPYVEYANQTTSVNYLVNLTNQLDSVYSVLLTKADNITKDEIGYLGTLRLLCRLENAIIAAPHSQFVSIPFRFEGNVIGLELAFQIPDSGNFIEKTWSGQDMSRNSPHRADIDISLDVGEVAESEMYVEWTILRDPLWWEVIPGSWIVSGAISFFTGVMSTIFLEHRYKITTRLSNIKNRTKGAGENIIARLKNWILRKTSSSDL